MAGPKRKQTTKGNIIGPLFSAQRKVKRKPGYQGANRDKLIAKLNDPKTTAGRNVRKVIKGGEKRTDIRTPKRTKNTTRRSTAARRTRR